MLSGGADSTALGLYLTATGAPPDLALHCASDWDWPWMQAHIDRLATIFPFPIHIATPPYTFTYYATTHQRAYTNPKTAKTRTVNGYGWPWWKARWCTAIKRDTLDTLCHRHGVPVRLIGYTADEPHRLQAWREDKRRRPSDFPLYDADITHAHAIEICARHGITFDNHYDHHAHLSCAICPFQSLAELRYLYEYREDLWCKILDIDRKVPPCLPPFKHDRTAHDLHRAFQRDPLLPGLLHPQKPPSHATLRTPPKPARPQP